MKSIRLKRDFSISSASDPDEVFNILADALHEAERESKALEDADVFAAGSNFTISIVGKGESPDAASEVANQAISRALQAVGSAIATFA